jgi:uncharacterized protein YdeI (YjbR/CyaY-like superfamily)
VRYSGKCKRFKNKKVVIPEELILVMDSDIEAKEFFQSLTNSYKRGYCNWMGDAKQATTRTSCAEKALAMIQRKQKTLKT